MCVPSFGPKLDYSVPSPWQALLQCSTHTGTIVFVLCGVACGDRKETDHSGGGWHGVGHVVLDYNRRWRGKTLKRGHAP